jgi:hypothetical protein
MFVCLFWLPWLCVALFFWVRPKRRARPRSSRSRRSPSSLPRLTLPRLTHLPLPRSEWLASVYASAAATIQAFQQPRNQIIIGMNNKIGWLVLVSFLSFFLLSCCFVPWLRPLLLHTAFFWLRGHKALYAEGGAGGSRVRGPSCSNKHTPTNTPTNFCSKSKPTMQGACWDGEAKNIKLSVVCFLFMAVLWRRLALVLEMGSSCVCFGCDHGLTGLPCILHVTQPLSESFANYLDCDELDLELPLHESSHVAFHVGCNAYRSHITFAEAVASTLTFPHAHCNCLYNGTLACIDAWAHSYVNK